MKISREEQDKYAETCDRYKCDIEEIQKRTEQLREEYNSMVDSINFVKQILLEDIRSLSACLKHIGSAVNGVSHIDFEREEHRKNECRRVQIKSYDVLEMEVKEKHPQFWKTAERNNEIAVLMEKEHDRLIKELSVAKLAEKGLEDAVEIAKLYYDVLGIMRECVKGTILPQMDLISAFLKAYYVAEEVCWNNAVTESKIMNANNIDYIKGNRKYEKHYIFVRNAHGYYCILSEFYKKNVLKNIFNKEDVLERKCIIYDAKEQHESAERELKQQMVGV